MNQPLLRFLATQNYKNLSLDKEINLKKLNIFIGSNGSGKSNFINCLKFLKDSLITIPNENRMLDIKPNEVQQKCPLFRELYNYLDNFCQNL